LIPNERTPEWGAKARRRIGRLDCRPGKPA
jgi:hypothetical protein